MPLGTIALLLAASFSLGALPLTGWAVRVFTRRDLRALGTGNVGVSAAFIHGGKLAGIAAVLAEIVRGITAGFGGAILLPGCTGDRDRPVNSSSCGQICDRPRWRRYQRCLGSFGIFAAGGCILGHLGAAGVGFGTAVLANGRSRETFCFPLRVSVHPNLGLGVATINPRIFSSSRIGFVVSSN
jgi:glycerol-3-phosphate acyltransferase PlsY